ncbi:hypothetical protein ACTWP5_23825 [Streptomyces sp. 4N509B]|uniref:hypothetical protein n=1 Tax=Streptomyces sp. 4N509B TaxID=3457413 RepID=UPI003FD0362A
MTLTPLTAGRALVAGAASLGLFALAGCEKPSPNAHFTLGSATSSPEAAADCWTEGGALSDERARQCLAGTVSGGVSDRPERGPSFTVRSGETFRVGVDPEIADDGWLLFVNGQPYGLEPFTGTYRSFRATDLFAVAQRNQSPNELPAPGSLAINVVQVSEEYELGAIFSARTQADFELLLYSSLQGVWDARLEPEGFEAERES